MNSRPFLLCIVTKTKKSCVRQLSGTVERAKLEKSESEQEDAKMANYDLYKGSGEMVQIAALLEDRADGYNVAFQSILRKNWANYDEITLLIPVEFAPDVYTGAYGDVILKVSLPTEQGSPAREPLETRLPVYEAGGDLWAYIDYKPHYSDERVPPEYGRTIRARFKIVRNLDDPRG